MQFTQQVYRTLQTQFMATTVTDFNRLDQRALFF